MWKGRVKGRDGTMFSAKLEALVLTRVCPRPLLVSGVMPTIDESVISKTPVK